MATTEEVVRGILVDDFDVDAGLLQADNTLVGSLNLDSLELIQLVITIEDKFNIEIPDEAMAATVTIGDLVYLIDKLTGEHL